jgi:hypothetical protein
MTSEFSTPENVSWCGSACQVATTASPSTRLLMRSPFSWAGPQPKQV